MNIPAADNLGLREEDGGVAIPLAPNLNDKGCLFAGSLFSGAILSAYRAAEAFLGERALTGELVAKTAAISYLKRVATEGRALATQCGGLVRKPNGNHALTVTVAVNDASGERCAEFKAEFILLARRQP